MKKTQTPSSFTRFALRCPPHEYNACRRMRTPSGPAHRTRVETIHPAQRMPRPRAAHQTRARPRHSAATVCWPLASNSINCKRKRKYGIPPITASRRLPVRGWSVEKMLPQGSEPSMSNHTMRLQWARERNKKTREEKEAERGTGFVPRRIASVLRSMCAEEGFEKVQSLVHLRCGFF